MPYRHARTTVEVRITARSIEIFAVGERIAAHVRGSGNGRHTTINDHMPSSHRRYADWTIERIVAEAGQLGPSVKLLCEMILQDRPHPEKGYRPCLGILRLARTYGAVKSILEKKLDGQPLHEPRAPGEAGIEHPNIRGSSYYH